MIFSIGILINIDELNAYFISCANEYGSFGFFERRTLSQLMMLAAREGTKNIRRIHNRFITIIDKKYPIDVALHLFCDEEFKFVISMVTDTIYPSAVCKRLMIDILNNFNLYHKTEIEKSVITSDIDIKNEFLISIIEKYQDPSSYCKLEKVKEDIEEIKELMINNIELILQRGVKLEELVQMSEDLSKESKRFLKASKKVNSCCIIM